MSLKYNDIKKYISSSRFSNYEVICNNDTNKAIKLYHTNLRLSQAFYPLLSLLEVILRNALNEELSAHFIDNNWLINQQKGFMSDSSLTYIDKRNNRKVINDYLKKNVAKAISDSRGKATQGQIIADVSFGFWTALFDKTHYKILAGSPIKIFSKLPLNSKRNTIHQKLKKLNDFRNRVYHNEAIIFDKDLNGNNIFSLQAAKEIYNEIQEFFDWLSLDYDDWTKRIDNVSLEIERAECLFNNFPSKKYYIHRIIIGALHYKRKYI